MADGTIDSLSIEIGASSTKAVEDIKKLADSLKELKSAQQSVKSGNSGTKNTFQNISNDSVQAMSKIDLLRKKLGILKQELNKKISLGKIDDKGFVNAALQIKNVEAQIDRTLERDLKAAQKSAKTSAGGTTKTGIIEKPADQADQGRQSIQWTWSLKANLKLIGDQWKGIGKQISSHVNPGVKLFASALIGAAKTSAKLASSIASFAKQKIRLLWDKSAFGALEKSLGRIKNVINSFSRIAFYRAIRSAIKYVTDQLKEGTENAYHYAKEFGNATRYIADAYDRISSSNFKMSNQIGAAWATLIAYIEPVIVQIINLVTRAADAVTQFFALMSGKGTYLKAVDYNKAWAESADDAAKAAKEWKNQLMGFDEINRLEEPSDPSSSSKSKKPTDYGNMFVESPVNDFFADIREAFENGEWARLGTLLGEKFNEIVDMIDWRGYGAKIGYGLQASIASAYNFIRTADFVNLGRRLSEFVNSAMSQINFSEAGRLWMRLRLALLRVIYGAVTGLDWKNLAKKLSDFVLGALDELEIWLKELKPDKITDALKEFIENIKYEEIGEKLKEVLKLAFGVLGDVVGGLLPDGMGDDLRDGIVDAIKEADFEVIHNVLMYKLDKALFGEKWANFWWSHGDYAGKDLVMSMITGVDSKGGDLERSLKGSIEDPTDSSLQNLKKTTNTHLTEIGTDIDLWNSGLRQQGNGLITFLKGAFTLDWSTAWSGIVDMVSGSVQTIFAWIQGLIDAVQGAIAWLRSLFSWQKAASWSQPITEARIKADTQQYDSSLFLGGFATGGFPEDGLFMANHGELVGKFSNGRTAVANNEQIVAGISAGVYDAVVSAFSQTGGNGGGDRPINIYLDSRLIGQSTTKYQNQRARAMG